MPFRVYFQLDIFLPVCDHSQGVTSLPTQEAEYSFLGFINQKNKKEGAGGAGRRLSESMIDSSLLAAGAALKVLLLCVTTTVPSEFGEVLAVWLYNNQTRSITCSLFQGQGGQEKFLVFGLLCRHTASNSSTADTHTSGAQ